MANFATYGPFRLSRSKNEVGLPALKEFRSQAEEVRNGLENACGVYIFATQHGDGPLKPWYVGQTHYQFGIRFRQHSRAHLFQDLYQVAPRGDLKVLLIAKVSSGNAFYRGSRKKIRSIRYVESALIGRCFICNKKLLNVSQINLHAGIYVPGLQNNQRGKPGPGARALADMLAH